VSWLFTIVGLVILILAGDILVRAAVNLSLRLGIPALIVSITVVAFGTSAPEMLIAVNAGLEKAPGIAIGNVVGSNTANVLLVLGLPALFAGLPKPAGDTRRTYIFMLVATALFIIACFLGPITWVHGLIFLAALFFILSDQIRQARAHRRSCAGDEVGEDHMHGGRIAFYLGVGIIGLPIGANLLVEGSVQIARTYGVSEAVIGLTLVAVGTSLPELATSVVAAMRKHGDVAIGNVIGSNIFNLLAITGVAALVGKIPVSESFLVFDLWVMLGASLLLIPFVFGKRGISRTWGFALTAVYAVYIISLLG